MKEKIFSVIIPVYNVEEYLEQTVESIINQTVGFENIELILINDGSTDNSEKICLEYKDKYPDNVVYIKQENKGVSAARNNALKYVSGKYVNFLDSDDIWDNDAFEKGLKLFEQNTQICAVIYPLKFFEASNKYHPLHFMFKNKENTTVNILEDYKYIKLSSCSTIFKSEVLKGREFNTKLKISEDCRLVTEIFLDNPNIGVVCDSNYNYRKRLSNSSTIQTSSSKRTWYIDTPVLCHKYIADLSKEKYGKVIDYVQFLLAYDLHWRMNEKIIDDLTEKEKKDYLDIMHSLVREIDDKIIIDFPGMNLMQKMYMLAFKYENKNIFEIKDDYFYCNDNEFYMINNLYLTVDNIVLNNDFIDIYGRQIVINNILDKVYVKTDYANVNFEYYELDKKHADKETIDNKYRYSIKGIHAKIDLSKTKTFNFMSKTSDKEFLIKAIFSYNSILNDHFFSLYLRTDNYYLKYIKSKQSFYVYKKGFKNRALLELKCDFNLIKRFKINSLIYRICGYISKLIHRKPIWLISDRIQIARDNGQAFFEYLINQKDLPVKPYFILSKNANDYKVLKAKYKRKLLCHNSFRHKMLHLAASKIISAQADNYVTNLFGNGKYYLGDLYNFEFVFLQHGITKDDLSPWLNINNRTIDMFVTASSYEYDSFTSGEYKYNFPKEWIKLTGFARFDKLIDDNVKKEKTILIMPTWRNNLVSLLDKKTGERLYDLAFKETDYFKYYNELINNERLLKYISKKGYKIRFIPHVNMMQQIRDFKTNEYVEIVSTSVNYTEEFQKNSLLITDYSSVFFDFCYLNKPVIYSQFDSDTFFTGQVYDKGYFSYEKHGFGPICKTINETVDNIIEIIDNDCKLNKKYKNKIDKFYKYHDKNNCKRIYDEIINLDKK